MLFIQNSIYLLFLVKSSYNKRCIFYIIVENYLKMQKNYHLTDFYVDSLVSIC